MVEAVSGWKITKWRHEGYKEFLLNWPKNSCRKQLRMIRYHLRGSGEWGIWSGMEGDHISTAKEFSLNCLCRILAKIDSARKNTGAWVQSLSEERALRSHTEVWLSSTLVTLHDSCESGIHFYSSEQKARMMLDGKACRLWLFSLPSLIHIFPHFLYLLDYRRWSFRKASPGLSPAGFHLGLSQEMKSKKEEVSGYVFTILSLVVAMFLHNCGSWQVFPPPLFQLTRLWTYFRPYSTAETWHRLPIVTRLPRCLSLTVLLTHSNSLLNIVFTDMFLVEPTNKIPIPD